MTSIVRRNGLLILPGGSKFCVAGTAPDPMPKLATNTLATCDHTQAVYELEGGLVRSPQGFYVKLAEDALDEAGVTYASGTVLFLPPESPVQVAAKTGGGGKTGQPLRIVHGRPYPRSAKAMASGMAMAGAAFVLGFVWLG